jgi:hypothetical protein
MDGTILRVSEGARTIGLARLEAGPGGWRVEVSCTSLAAPAALMAIRRGLEADGFGVEALPVDEAAWVERHADLIARVRAAEFAGELAEYENVHDWLYEHVEGEVTKSMEAALEAAGVELR